MQKTPYLLAVAFSLLVVSCKQTTDNTTPGPISQDSLVKRGAYLVTVLGCSDCHTPKKMSAEGPVLDMDLLLSGHPSSQPIPKIDTAALKNWVLFNMSTTAMVGPWGVSFTANLTSDETGIGSWTEAQFFTALRKGKSKGIETNRSLLPPMPWSWYGQASDEDLRAIFAYLKSTKPVKNVVPQPIPPTQLASIK